MKVLVCDDDKTALIRADLMLKKIGFETIALEDPKEALRVLCASQPPKIAILDWMMPGLSGVDICKRVREMSTPVSIYIIILTSRDTADDAAEALDAGANDFMTKPFDPIEFRARVAAGVRIVNLESELKTLTGLISICSWCKKVKSQDMSWVRIEEYIEKNTYAQLTHGGCPECIAKVKAQKALSKS